MITDHRTPNRHPATLLQAINPLWWASDAERNMKWSWIKWFCRNPFCNFTMTIIGIADSERDCHYAVSGWTYATTGWNYGWSTPTSRFPRIPFPFISHRGRWIEWAIGWKTSGGFTIQLRRSNSPNAEETA